jgi:hypothetical protein
MKTIIKKLTLCLVMTSQLTSLSFAEEDGDFRTTFIHERYSYYEKTPTAAVLAKYIFPNTKLHIGKSKWTPAKRMEYSNLLAKRILVITDCLDLDPILFSAILREESHFDNKRQNPKSSAIGFGQILKIAIREVNDQFSMPDIGGVLGTSIESRGRREAREYFEDTMRTCLEPNLKIKNFINIWERADVKKHALYSDAWYKAASTQIMNDDILSLVISASLLKVYYSVVKTKIINEHVPGTPAMTKLDFLKRLLKEYGEPNDAYQSKMLKAATELKNLK